MLKSDPNYVSSILHPRRNKVLLENKSEYEVHCEIKIYEKAQIKAMENGLTVGPGGVTNKIEWDKITPLDTEECNIQPNDDVNVTIARGDLFRLRYKYNGLHDDFSDEQRKFTVYDRIRFLQPSQEKINTILQEKKRDLQEAEAKIAEQKRIEQEAKEKRERQEREEREERERRERINRKCSSLHKFNCSASDTEKSQCPKCKDWYCNAHIDINYDWVPIFGKGGGHVCRR